MSLLEYVQHKDNCAKWLRLEDGSRMVVPDTAGIPGHDCTCGLTPALKADPPPLPGGRMTDEDTRGALQYARGLMENALAVASPYHAPFIQRHISALDELAVALPSSSGRE